MNRLAELLRLRPIQVGVLITVAYWLVAAIGVPARMLIEAGDVYCIPFSALASWIYSRRILDHSNRPPDYIDLMIIGIWGAWTMNALDRSWRLAGRLVMPDQPQLLNSYILGYLLFMLAYFAALHILVKGATESSATKRVSLTYGIRLIWAGLGAGTGLALVVVAWHEILL